MDFGIAYFDDKEGAKDLSNSMLDFLENKGFSARVIDSLKPDNVRYDVLISVGGDGSFLYNAVNFNYDKILGVKLGESIGAHCSSSESTVLDDIEMIIQGKHFVKEMNPIDVYVDGKFAVKCLNEVQIRDLFTGQLFKYNVSIDGFDYAGGCDEVYFYVPQGWSGHVQSLGAPQVNNGKIGLFLSGLAYSDKYLPKHRELDEEEVVLSGEYSFYLCVDGRRKFLEEISPAQKITLKKSPSFNVIVMSDFDEFYPIFSFDNCVAVSPEKNQYLVKFITKDKKEWIRMFNEGVDKGDIKFHTDFINLLDSVKNYSILSMDYEENVEYLFSKHPGIKKPQQIVGLDFCLENNLEKPNRDLLFELINRIRIPQWSMLYVGDKPVDVELADNARCVSVLINRDKSHIRVNPNHLIEDLTQLEEIIK